MPWINVPKIEGKSSRQAHVDLPNNTYERELGKEGFYGPATQMYHQHPPTSWSKVEGGLRPRAFDTKKLIIQGASPWNAALLFHNENIRIRYLQMQSDMDHLVRNADGDELLLCTRVVVSCIAITVGLALVRVTILCCRAVPSGA